MDTQGSSDEARAALADSGPRVYRCHGAGFSHGPPNHGINLTAASRLQVMPIALGRTSASLSASRVHGVVAQFGAYRKGS